MNERIKLLAEQAQTVVGYTDGGYTEIKALDQEKFAELIIKETLEVARAGVEFGDGMESAVENYFGVKL